MNKSVSIFVTRNGDKKDDDVIHITPCKNSIVVKYVDSFASESFKRTKLILPKDGLVSYIQNVAYLFMVDTDPFKNMQFNFPGFPAFMTTPSSLQNVDTQDAIMHVAGMVSESWFSEEEDEVEPQPQPLTNDAVYRQAYQEAYDEYTREDRARAHARPQAQPQQSTYDGCDCTTVCDDCEELPPLVSMSDDIWKRDDIWNTPSRPTSVNTKPPRLNRSHRMSHSFY
jgi:hypothetical protein